MIIRVGEGGNLDFPSWSKRFTFSVVIGCISVIDGRGESEGLT